MNTDDYEVCVPVSDEDNAWLINYNTYRQCDFPTYNDVIYDVLGLKYVDVGSLWYYVWNKEERRYYVVVPKSEANGNGLD